MSSFKRILIEILGNVISEVHLVGFMMLGLVGAIGSFGVHWIDVKITKHENENRTNPNA